LIRRSAHPTPDHQSNDRDRQQRTIGSDLRERVRVNLGFKLDLLGGYMNEDLNPEETESGKEHLKAAADEFKVTAGGKIEDLRQATGQKIDEFQKAAEGKAQEVSDAAEKAWSDARSKGKSWLAEGEAYVRNDPTKALVVALTLGIILGLRLRK
jgi:ElaB/YqjD/DUF883 family membrane-anchored ribosome-binding protein